VLNLLIVTTWDFYHITCYILGKTKIVEILVPGWVVARCNVARVPRGPTKWPTPGAARGPTQPATCRHSPARAGHGRHRASPLYMYICKTCGRAPCSSVLPLPALLTPAPRELDGWARVRGVTGTAVAGVLREFLTARRSSQWPPGWRTRRRAGRSRPPQQRRVGPCTVVEPSFES
jgi:hypothetical protein